MKFIEKLEFNVDVNKLNQDLDNFLKVHPWPERTIIDDKVYPANQLGLTHRTDAKNKWIDAGGNLYDSELKQFIAKESDFSEINEHVGNYTKNVLADLATFLGVSFGRIRYMRMPMKQGLTVHRDFEVRYHIVLKTNPNAMFGQTVAEDDVVAKCYHIPADGHVYKVDTTRDHFIYNGGWDDRIHLVLCTA